MIQIDIEIKKRSRVKEFFNLIKNKLEDSMFSIIQKLPEKFIPRFLMEWLDKYTTQRVNELKYQTIKQTWIKISLEKAINNIRQQDIEKAPSED